MRDMASPCRHWKIQLVDFQRAKFPFHGAELLLGSDFTVRDFIFQHLLKLGEAIWHVSQCI